MANAYGGYSPIASAFRDLGIQQNAATSSFMQNKLGAQQFDPYFMMSKYGADLSAVADPYSILASAADRGRAAISLFGPNSAPSAVSPVPSSGGSGPVSYVAPASPVSYAPTSYTPSTPPAASSIPSVGAVPAAPSGSGVFSYSGAPISNVTRWSPQVQNAIQTVYQNTGIQVPENLVYAIMQLESGGDPNAVSSAGYVGLMQVGSGSNISNFDPSAAFDPQQNINYGVEELANWYQVTGDWNTAPLAYFSGYNWQNGATSDGHYSNNQYYTEVQSNLADLGGLTANQVTQQSATGKPVNAPRRDQIISHLVGQGRINAEQYAQMSSVPGGVPGDTPTSTAQAVIDVATSYVGLIPYPSVWQGNPGAGQDPMTYGGWDCSGFTYWLDQNYGDQTLPQGSHFQYQYAVDNGLLFTDTTELLPGDLVFMDTGWYGGAGGDLNPAGHVGMYIGNGQIVNSLNPSSGTVISNVSDFPNILGYMHMSWSGQGVPAESIGHLQSRGAQTGASHQLFGAPAPQQPPATIQRAMQPLTQQQPSLRASANQALSGYRPPAPQAPSAPPAATRNTSYAAPQRQYSQPAPSYTPQPQFTPASTSARSRNLF